MPLWGSSGSISPSSIFVRIIRANLLKSSSTFSPDNADTSTATGILDLEAHLEASSSETSRPSGEMVAVILVPAPGLPIERRDPLESNGNGVCLLEVLDGVAGGRRGSSQYSSMDAESEARSHLFPASNTVRLGEASARASIRKVGRALKDECDATS